MHPLNDALPFPEGDGHGGSRQEEEEIDASGDQGIHAQYRGQPYHQQTSAADAQTGEKSQRSSDHKGHGNTIQDNAALPR